ncbi:MAG: alpha/beta hydrolase [Candidatus Obscuribacterales bacterium]|nr:alpha/beta hydrolase [Candidatus Obscuribacterales bacterium]
MENAGSSEKLTAQNALSKSLLYLIAAFRPSLWKKAGQEILALSRPKAGQALSKAGLYYILFCPLVAMPFYNTCIFHPFVCGDFDLKEIASIKKEDCFFKNSDNIALHAWYFRNPKAARTVLLSHGNAGNLTHRKELIKVLLESGASVFAYDYQGFGLSKGSPSVEACIKDAIAAYDYLHRDLKVPGNQIVLYGESIGTAFSCQLAKARPELAAIILQSGFQSLPQIAHEKVALVKIYPKESFPCNKLDTLEYVKGKHPPLLIIHGEKDSTISSHNADELYKAAGGETYLVKLPDADHNNVPLKLNYAALSALSRFCRTESKVGELNPQSK